MSHAAPLLNSTVSVSQTLKPRSSRPLVDFDVVCLSHLRWNFVFQRPQHLMTRWARDKRVFFVEEPIEGPRADSTIQIDKSGVIVVTPTLPKGLTAEARLAAQRLLLDELSDRFAICTPLLWYYTPMALPFSRHLNTAAIVYDCMDELSGFLGCPPELILLERELMSHADVMFTGGQSLFESKRKLHRNVHPFPSSVDVNHFGQARSAQDAPADQAEIPGPRIGFHGVIDERMNLQLVREVALARPNYHFIFLGPVVKIDPETLPKLPNVHFLGCKTYEQLPTYLAGWDATMMPFALNEATRFISPTKTPEYLAGGKPVVSTPIQDVVRPYGDLNLVRIANTSAEFAAALDDSLNTPHPNWLRRADRFLAGLSWDRTWKQMRSLVEEVTQRDSSLAQLG